MRWKWIAVLAILLIPKAARSIEPYWDDSGWGLSFSETDLQQQINRKFPIKKISQEIFTVECSSPVVDLSLSTNTITVAVAVKAYLLIEEAGFSGVIKVAGSPFYDADKGSLFIRNASIAEINIVKFPEKHKKYLEVLRGVAGELLAEHFNVTPVYTLNPDNLKESLMKSFLKSVGIKNKQLYVTASLF